jgi:hypothetical protein
MGGLCQPTVDTTPGFTDTVAGTDIPEWVSQAGQETFGQAKALATTPFQPYTGPRISDFSGDETAGFDATRANVGSFQPLMNQAGSFTTQGGQQWGANAAQQYMNPFQQNVTDIAARELNRQADFQTKTDNAAAVAANSFGGARHGILNAENERNRSQALGDLYSRGQAAAYDNAQSMFNADQGRSLQAGQLSGQLAGQQQQLGFGDAAALANIGQAQRGMEQASLDTAYGDYLEQREYPYRQVNFALGALKGTPYETQQYQQGTSVTPQLSTSPFGQAAGALGSLVGGAGLYDRFKSNGTN